MKDVKPEYQFDGFFFDDEHHVDRYVFKTVNAIKHVVLVAANKGWNIEIHTAGKVSKLYAMNISVLEEGIHHCKAIVEYHDKQYMGNQQQLGKLCGVRMAVHARDTEPDTKAIEIMAIDSLIDSVSKETADLLL